MKKLFLIILLIIVMAPATANCGKCKVINRGFGPEYEITFHNVSIETVACYLYHVDHNFRTLKDVNVAAGELEPGREWTITRPKGVYYITWRKVKFSVLTKETDTFTLKKDMEFHYP